MPDLKTKYLGLELKNPLVASSSPLSTTLDGIKRLEEAGASAVVLFSLFEEQLLQESNSLDHFLAQGTDSFGEALSYFPQAENYHLGPDAYLELIRKARASVGIPLIASLNGVSKGGWTEYAKAIAEAGASALELNVYYVPTNPAINGAEVETMYRDVVAEVKSHVNIPVAVKLSPYFSSTAHMAQQMVDAGASGLVLFNRFYQPDFDLDKLEVQPRLVLSTSEELRLPLRWIAILYGRIAADFAITSGVHTHLDVIKSMMAGARVTMMASELLKNGVGRIGEILTQLQAWMEEFEYESVQQMQGSMSQKNVAEPAAFERANYMRMLQSWRPEAVGMLK